MTGQDAELAAIQRILTGDQQMTVYKAIRPQAERAAEVAVALIEGDEFEAPLEIQGTSVDAARACRGDDRQHHGDRRGGRILDRRRHLHARSRRRVRRGRHPMTAAEAATVRA